jgi:hypothetical protein
MSGAVKMVIDDPAKFGLLTLDMKQTMIQGGIAAVNVMAALARKEAVKNLEKDFINRNTFTKRQVQFTPMASGRYSLEAIHSVVGVTKKAAYMARQEEGGEHTPASGSTLAVPTDTARGGSFRNPVQKGMRVKDVVRKNARVRRPTSQDYFFLFYSVLARHIARAYIAYKYNLYLPQGGNGNNSNLFRVTSFTPVGEGAHRHIKFTTEMVYSFEHKSTYTKSRPWFIPACEKVAKDRNKIFESQMKKLGM